MLAATNDRFCTYEGIKKYLYPLLARFNCEYPKKNDLGDDISLDGKLGVLFPEYLERKYIVVDYIKAELPVWILKERQTSGPFKKPITVRFYNKKYEQDFVEFLMEWLEKDAYKYFSTRKADFIPILDKINAMGKTTDTPTLNNKKEPVVELFNDIKIINIAEKKLIREMRKNFGKENRMEYYEKLLTPEYVNKKLDRLLRIIEKYYPDHKKNIKKAIADACDKFENGIKLTTKFHYPTAAYIFDHCVGHVGDYVLNRGGEARGIVLKAIKAKIEDFIYNSIGLLKIHYKIDTKNFVINDGENRTYLLIYEYFVDNLVEYQLADTLSTEIEIYTVPRFIQDHVAQNNREAQTNSVRILNEDFASGYRVKEIQEFLIPTRQTNFAFATAAKKKVIAVIMEYYLACGGKNTENYTYVDFHQAYEKIIKTLSGREWTKLSSYPEYLLRDIANAIEYYEEVMRILTKRINTTTLRNGIRTSSGLLGVILLDRLCHPNFQQLAKNPKIVAKHISKNAEILKDHVKTIAQKGSGKANEDKFTTRKTKELTVSITFDCLTISN